MLLRVFIAVVLAFGALYSASHLLELEPFGGDFDAPATTTPSQDDTMAMDEVANPATPKKEVIAPEPLVQDASESGVSAELSQGGIIAFTNRHRAEANLPLLSENAELNAAAEAKARDMVERQYFAHESPTGEGPSDLADNAGYDYILVGENLALGNYEDDKTLVQAWMDSPGHRENILHNRFREIGVAAIRGEYEGRTVWFAVQEFGLPASACPAPSEALNREITKNQDTLARWQEDLDELSNELDQTPRNSPRYNELVEEYNELANRYNELLSQTRSQIERYNSQVDSYNACLEG